MRLKHMTSLIIGCLLCSSSAIADKEAGDDLWWLDDAW